MEAFQEADCALADRSVIHQSARKCVERFIVMVFRDMSVEQVSDDVNSRDAELRA